MVFSRINRIVRSQKPFPGNEIQLQAGWGTGPASGSDHVPPAGKSPWRGCPRVSHRALLLAGVDPVPFFTLLGRSTSVIPHQSATALDKPEWSFFSHGAAREQAKGTSTGDGQGDGLRAAVVSCLLMLWLCFSFWPEAGKFGACLRAVQFLQTVGYAQHGKVEVKPTVLKRVINKG